MIYWRKTNPISGDILKETENKLNIQFPKDLYNLILGNNHGRPDKPLFDTNKSKEKMIGALLEFDSNSEHSDNVVKVYSAIKNRLPKNLYPFGSDPAGNYICIDINNGEIYFWNHEYQFDVVDDRIDLKDDPSIEFIALSLNEFLDKLYID